MSVADPRLARLKRLIEGLAPQLDLDIAIRLWDGEALPLGRHWSGDLALALRDPVAITRLLRRPRLTTLVELFAEGKLDIEGGTLLDVAARQGGGSSRGLLKKVNKLAATMPWWCLTASATGAKRWGSNKASGLTVLPRA